MNEPKQFSTETAPDEIASELISEFRATGQYPRERVQDLIELAISEDRETSELASRAFFVSLVERLADSFEPAAVSLYNRAFAQLIQACCSSRQGREIARELKAFNLSSEADLIARAESLRRRQPPVWTSESRSKVRRVVALSRVTLGADVAITSVIIERVKREFPNASITLVGGRKAAELFGGDARLSFREINYVRAATAIERLLSWLDVLAAVRETIGDLKRSEHLIVDPDSRLTQLGLLPASRSKDFTDSSSAFNEQSIYTNESLDGYLFFPSREYKSDTNHSLAELTSMWLNEIFGATEQIYPCISLARADINTASELVARIGRGSERPVIAINFGVGGNLAKRVGDRFEHALVARLIAAGAMVILDKGAGSDESRRADAIINNTTQIRLDGQQVRVIETDETHITNLLNSDRLDADMLVWNGRIGLLAALISASDLYIGYDSAGQHIAAAAGVPCIDLFAGFSSTRMLDRWRPTGRAETRVIRVDAPADENEILSTALHHAREMLKNSGQ
ncbi:MAG TPA: glycosyltransferase family 9 protein [Blastocatellia bacterium]|nr:glycosyltransferase family 9 protein [Blastocatellia bacterium]